ncbi:hypothetical protein Tco_0500024 [Tanacetum coccineum]
MIDENTPPPRRVYFANTITLVKRERESRDTTPREHEGLTSKVDDEVGSNELEMEEKDDLEYFSMFPSMKELEYHEWLLKNPRPPWINFPSHARPLLEDQYGTSDITARHVGNLKQSHWWKRRGSDPRAHMTIEKFVSNKGSRLELGGCSSPSGSFLFLL